MISQHSFFVKCIRYLAGERHRTSHREKVVGALGGGLGIALVFGVSFGVVDSQATVLMLASMGASAVLLFAVPHGALSQPWSLLGGHVLSALIGVSCYRWLPQPWLAAPVAVGLAVAAMSYLHCLHPPGGATALAAVIGGPTIHDLGYFYLLLPVGLNALLLLMAALAYNNLFPWRRYPAVLMAKGQAAPSLEGRLQLTHEDFAAAIHALDTYVDVTSEELAALFEKAGEHAREHQPAKRIRGGAFYSNGAIGREWAVRQVIDMGGKARRGKAQVIYKVMAGDGLYEVGICSLESFQRWAAFEVRQQGQRWLRAVPDDCHRQ